VPGRTTFVELHDHQQGYGLTPILLHWIGAILIIGLFSPNK